MVVPPKHPKMIIFSRKTHGCWVPPFRKPPYGFHGTLTFAGWSCHTTCSLNKKVGHLRRPSVIRSFMCSICFCLRDENSDMLGPLFPLFHFRFWFCILESAPFMCVSTLKGGFLKWWYPTTMGFPTKKDHFGVFGGYHHLRKHAKKVLCSHP